MRFLIFILSFIVFTKTLSYGIFEIHQNNKSGGISVIIISIFSFILPNIMIYINGI